MSVQFPRGKIIGPEDLSISLVDQDGNPTDAYEISYALYSVVTGGEVLIGPEERQPVHRERGMYHASFQIPEDADIGLYRIRWRFQQTTTSPVNEVMEEFKVVEKSHFEEALWSKTELSMINRLRILLRDNCVDGSEVIEVKAGGEIMEVAIHELWEILDD